MPTLLLPSRPRPTEIKGAKEKKDEGKVEKKHHESEIYVFDFQLERTVAG